MKSVMLATLVVLAVGIASVNSQATPTCPTNPYTEITPEECQSYTKEGAIYVVFTGRSEALTAAEEEQFRVSIANVSNDYILLTVEPEHVMIVQRGRHSATNDYSLYFFILNPSLSTVMPVALRKQELYLMVNLNNKEVNDLMGEGYTIEAVEPPSGYPLAVPVWAVAILGYVGLVILVYCVMVLTSDWRKRRFAEFEADLEKQYQENGNANGDTNGIALTTVTTTSNEYTELKKEKLTMDVAVQTPRHVAIQVDPEEILREAAGLAITKAVIENGDAKADDHRYEVVADTPSAPPEYEPTDTTDVAPLVSSSRDENDDDGDAAKDAEDIAAAIEGAVNVGFEGDGDSDGDKGEYQISTKL